MLNGIQKLQHLWSNSIVLRQRYAKNAKHVNDMSNSQRIFNILNNYVYEQYKYRENILNQFLNKNFYFVCIANL